VFICFFCFIRKSFKFRSINEKRVVSSLIRRPFRLGLPILFIMILNLILFSILFSIGFQHFKDDTRFLGTSGKWYDFTLLPFHYLLGSAPLHSPIPGPAWTLKSITTYLVTLMILQYEKQSQARWIILIASLFWFSLIHHWAGHFISGLILAHMDNVGFLKKCTL
jgi:hypothetical protein